MRAGQASGTAERVAIERAAHQVIDRPVVFADPLALRVISAEAAAALRDHPEQHDRSPIRRYIRAIVVVRSRIAEDELARAVNDGVTQYVLLGAGLDTFAYRNPHPLVRVFEVDHPATQALKRERLVAAGIAIPRSVTYVPIDFGRDTLGAALDAAGFDRTRPAIFAWLGVVMYLRRDAVMDTLGFIASLPERTAVIFDYARPPSALSFVPRLFYRRMLARLEAQGEPWTAFFEAADLRADLLRLGFSEVDDLNGDAINRQYLAAHGNRLQAGSAGAIVVARK